MNHPFLACLMALYHLLFFSPQYVGYVGNAGVGGGGNTKSFTQGGYNSQSFSSATLTLTLTGVSSTKTSILCGFAWSPASETLNSLGDTHNSYIIIDNPSTGSGISSAMAYATIATGGTLAISAVFSSSSLSSQMACHEVAGSSAAPVPDGTQPAMNYQASVGTGTDLVTSNSITPTQTGDYLFGVSTNDSGTALTLTAGTGFTNRETGNLSRPMQTEDEIDSASSAISATFTTSVSSSFVTGVMAFK